MKSLVLSLLAVVIISCDSQNDVTINRHSFTAKVATVDSQEREVLPLETRKEIVKNKIELFFQIIQDKNESELLNLLNIGFDLNQPIELIEEIHSIKPYIKSRYSQAPLSLFVIESFAPEFYIPELIDKSLINMNISVTPETSGNGYTVKECIAQDLLREEKTDLFFNSFKLKDIRSHVYIELFNNENRGTIFKLIAHGLSPDTHYFTKSLLTLAIESKDDELLDLLINKGADVNIYYSLPSAGGDWTLMDTAIQAGDIKYVEKLIEYGFNLSKYKETYLWENHVYHRKEKNSEIIEYLESL